MARQKVGDVYAIKLPDGNYAFGRVMQENGIQIFEHTNNEANGEGIDYEKIRLIVNLYQNAFNDSRMQKITSVAFKNEDDSWVPNTCIYNIVSKKYSIYSRGKIMPSTKEECEGLEPTAAWALDHVIDQLTGRHNWLKSMNDIQNFKPRT